MSGSHEAITFDVGGTLLQPWPSVGHVYAKIAARHGLTRLSPGLLDHQFAAVWGKLQDFDYTRAGWAKLVDAVFAGLTPAPPSQTFFPDLYDHFALPEAWRVFEDVVPTLEALAARGLRLGVISNWDERLRPLLRRLKLDGYFAAIVVSCEAGCAKPDPAIFHRAARELELPPRSVLHVGDSLALDAEGARAAGMRACLLRRGAPHISRGQIRSLKELTDMAGALSSSQRVE